MIVTCLDVRGFDSLCLVCFLLSQRQNKIWTDKIELFTINKLILACLEISIGGFKDKSRLFII